MNMFLKSMIFSLSLMPCVDAMQPNRTTKPTDIAPIANDAQALFELGHIYLKKINEFNYMNSPHTKTAFEYFKKAADLNHSKAQHMTGVCYKDGGGVEIDLSKAFEYFIKASKDLNNLEAHYELGSAYLNGHGTQQNIPLGIKSLTHAAKRGHKIAGMEIGLFYMDQDLVAYNDYGKALHWLKKPAQNGDPAAQCALAWMYRHGGQGVLKNEKLVFENLSAAAKKGHVKAYWLLGGCYEEGTGVEKSFSEARFWYHRAMDWDKHPTTQEACRQSLLLLALKEIQEKEKLLSIPNIIKTDLKNSPVITKPQQKTKAQKRKKPTKKETTPAVQEMAEPLSLTPQETQVFTKTSLRKLSVEEVTKIYAKTLVEGTLSKSNPSKMYMIDHILSQQSQSIPELKNEIPQIPTSDAEELTYKNAPILQTEQESSQTPKDLYKSNLVKARKGELEAIYQLGLAYFNGSGTPQNLESAKECFTDIITTTDVPDELKNQAKKMIATIEQLKSCLIEDKDKDKDKDKKPRRTLPLMERKASKRKLHHADSLSKSERSMASQRSSECWATNTESHADLENEIDHNLINEIFSPEHEADSIPQIPGRIIAYSTKGLSDVKRLLKDDEQAFIEGEIAKDPTAKNAPIIQHSGGARKVRFAKDGMGKSYGIRVIYTYNPMKDKIIIIRVYDKSEQQSLSRNAKQEIKSFLQNLKKTSKK